MKYRQSKRMYWALVMPLVAAPTLGYLVVAGSAESRAETYASAERSAAAVGHYSRARALLVEALAEFEQARKIARPDLLIDSEEWRLSIISRTEELNRVLDPQPRVTRSGVRFKATGLLIKHARDQVPAVPDGARDSNTFGEQEREKEFSATVERLERETPTLTETKPAKRNRVKKEVVVEIPEPALNEQADQPLKEDLSENAPIAPATTDHLVEPHAAKPTEKTPVDDAEIEAAIQERLKRLRQEEEQAQSTDQTGGEQDAVR